MNVFKLSQRGEAHPNHNQDYAISHTIGDHHLLIAVLDGCSSGIDSYFAATLMGKLLRKAAIQLDHLAFVEKTLPSSFDLLKRSTQLLFSELGQLGRQLHLRREEMLSTALLAVVDRDQREAELLAAGDGLIACNHQLIHLEQGTAPDYLAYHLDEAFQDWFNQQRYIHLSNVQDLSICTDGIFSFAPYEHMRYPICDDHSLISLLLFEKEEQMTPHLLKKRLIQIETKWGLKPKDDLSIIRLLLPQKQDRPHDLPVI